MMSVSLWFTGTLIITIVRAQGGLGPQDYCPTVCSQDYRPVCGSDDQTYANECVLRSNACQKNQLITVRSKGPCSGTCNRPIDLVFAHDASGSIDKSYDYGLIKNFTKDLIDTFEIGVSKTHIGVVVYSHIAQVAIKLDETFDKDELKAKVDNIAYLGYTTAIDDALRICSNDMFSLRGGVRQGVPLVLIVLTDGRCTACKQPLGKAVAPLREKGVEIFSIGVSDAINITELEQFTSTPFIDHLVKVTSFEKLHGLIKGLTKGSCEAKSGKCPAIPVEVECPEETRNFCLKDTECKGVERCCFDGCARQCLQPVLHCIMPIEIAFALDSSSSIRPIDYEKMKTAVKKIIDSFHVSQRQTRFSLLLYSNEPKVIFNFVRYDTAGDIKDAVDNMIHLKGGTRIDKVLAAAKEDIFSLKGFVRQGRPMVLIVLTDGSTQYGSEPLEVAVKPLVDYGVKVMAVGVGPEVTDYELKKFASEDSIVKARNFDDLLPNIFALTQKICHEKPGFCSAVSPLAESCDSVREDLCKHDFDCYGNSKCCFNGCRKTCERQEEVCRRKVDLAFLIDQSSSVGARNFEIMKDFIKTTIGHFNVGPQHTHVAVICFGTDAKVEFNFNDNLSAKAAKGALDRVRYIGGESRLDTALALADKKIFSESEGMRNVFKLLVVLTDGGISTYAPCQGSCGSLRNKGVNVAAVGVGPAVEVATLQEVTSITKEETNIFLAKTFSDMSQFAQDISNVACFAGAGSQQVIKEDKTACGTPKCLPGPKGSMGRQGPPGQQGEGGQRGGVGPSGIQGSIGQKGENGEQGNQGTRGDMGLRGMPGHPGINGIPGIPGIQGKPGPHGPCGTPGKSGGVGLPGPDGLPGRAGLPGRNGPNGLKGESMIGAIPTLKGNSGDRGTDGSRGYPGPIGRKGQAGYKGESGIDGVNGGIGLPGERGDPRKITRKKGPKGKPGDVGDAGLSASVHKKTTKLQQAPKGDPGLPGEKGAPGDRGEQGTAGTIPGISGPHGPAGPEGDDGDNGIRGPPGEVGPRGPVGSRGAIGEPGPLGPKGFQGEVGTKGDEGSSGAPGVDGLTGDPGFGDIPGPRGIKGEPGRAGFHGAQGSRGAEGFIGKTGKRGMVTPGPPGFTGDQGTVGPRGNPGISGFPGMDGPPGPRGQIGPKGNRGNDGRPGKPLPGKDGMDGGPGTTGVAGSRGDVGPQGTRGKTTYVRTLCIEGVCPKGTKGLLGPPGNSGPVGSGGIPGPLGVKGASGGVCPLCPRGDQGVPGEAGRPGMPGQDGKEGFNGPKGLQGDEGDQGPVGPAGETGSPGAGGPTGERGIAGDLGEAAEEPEILPIGPAGDVGELGDEGERGPIGPKGLVGQPGADGPIGPAGELGVAGDAGTPGADGLTGFPGNPGEIGDLGDSIWGIAGAKGDRGREGEQGKAGDPGLRGAPGDRGEFPSEAEFEELDLLIKRTKGAKGDNGTKGDKGFPEEKGTSGRKGPKGEPGVDAVAEIGLVGPDGLEGEVGEVGDAGEQGPVGMVGVGGLSDDGIDGEKGFRGPKGKSGCDLLRPDPLTTIVSKHTDLAFLVDASDDVCETSFQKSKGFVKQVLDVFRPSPDGTHVGIIEYSSIATIEVDFDDYFDRRSLDRAVDSIPCAEGIRHIQSGLEQARDNLYRELRGHRTSAQKVLVLLVGGSQSLGSDTAAQNVAQQLKSRGVKIFVVGIGPEVDRAVLTRLASDNLVIFTTGGTDLMMRGTAIVKTVENALKVVAPAGITDEECARRIKGRRGEDGDPGDAGFPGNPGRDADTGAKGSLGMVGESGLRGSQGDKGDMGTGIPGPPGRDGLMGFPGDKGATGESGIDGREGRPGKDGEPGDAAVFNIPGDKGQPGDNGRRGPAGPPGDKLCIEMMKTDLGFLLHTSVSVSHSDFSNMKRFANSIVDAFAVTSALTHVSVLTYAAFPEMEFAFSSYTNLGEVKENIQAIENRQGGPPQRIDSALSAANNQMFTTGSGSRSNAHKVLILFVDGQQSSAVSGRALDQSIKRLSDRGIRLYVVGVGTELDQSELLRIAKTEDRLLLARSYDDLLTKVEDEVNKLADDGCKGAKGEPGFVGIPGEKGFRGPSGNPGRVGLNGMIGVKGLRGPKGFPTVGGGPMPTGDVGERGIKGTVGLPGCPDVEVRIALDIAFLVDASGSLYEENYRKEKSFLKKVINAQTLGRHDANVGIISYSRNAVTHVKFNNNYNKAQLLRAIDNLPYEARNTRIDKALELARKELFVDSAGSREDAKKVIVLLTDGQQSDAADVIDLKVASQRLKDKDVEIYAVGIGAEIDWGQLRQIVSRPEYIFFASDFDRLISEIAPEVTTALKCEGGPRGMTGRHGTNGEIGESGPAGIPGEVGRPGNQGFKGFQGMTGNSGIPGEDNVPGPKGVKGEIGRRGDDGFPGDNGRPGLTGSKGAIGEEGPTGPRGIVGLRGFEGRKGQKGGMPRNLIGNKGETGDRGDQGPSGSFGLPGLKGDPSDLSNILLRQQYLGRKGVLGPRGPPGPRGEPGDIIAPKGNPGELAKGGPKGIQGDPGFAGPFGDFGRDGEKGEPGLRGFQGLPGIDGPRGDEGPRGPQGERGNPGLSPKGPVGDFGEAGLQGNRGVPGNVGPPGFMGLDGITGAQGEVGPPGSEGRKLVGPKGVRGNLGFSGLPGIRGDHGPPGDSLDVISGDAGPGGPEGYKGERGETGPQGHAGFSGLPGVNGFHGRTGEDGDPGRAGRKGAKGELGDVIDRGNRNNGDPGEIGFAGRPGLQGPNGFRGPTGVPGIIGPRGDVGSRGYSGFPGVAGDPGIEGESGPRGLTGPIGSVGESGEVGAPGPAGVADGFYIVRHSQTDRVPACPRNHKKLWDGYSLVYTVGNGMAHGQDLANAGSCVTSFNTLPFLFCEIFNNCKYSSRNDFMYWLSAKNAVPMMPVAVSAVSPFISRCAVCEIPAVHMAVHSQDTFTPPCPFGWDSLWTGYSFLMMTGSGGTGTGQSLSTSGSCLEEFRANPFLECQGERGTCHFFADKFSFWLTTVDKQTQFQTQQSETLSANKGDDLKSRVSRCRVCVRGRNKTQNNNNHNILSRVNRRAVVNLLS